MSTKLQALIAVCVVVGIFYILQLIRRNKLEIKYALSWLVVGGFVLVLDLLPGFIEFLSDVIGIAEPVNMIFLFGFIFTLAIILSLTVALSITATSFKRLNQKVGMLDKKIRELEGKK